MKTKSIFLPFLIVVFLCLPFVSVAQGTADAMKKGNKRTQPNLQHMLSKDIVLKPYNGRSAMKKVVQDNRLESSLNSRKAIDLATLPENFKKVYYSAETGLPIFIQTLPGKSTVVKSSALDTAAACFSYLNKIKSLLKTDRPEDQFTIRTVQRDKYNKTHVRLDQVYKGIPVFGGDIVVHLNEAGEGEYFNGRYFKVSGEISTIPALQPDAAIGFASLHLYKGSKPEWKEPGLPLLASKEKTQSSLVLYRKNNNPSEPVLAYHITLFTPAHHRWEYFIDAASGEVLHYYENTCFIDGKRTTTAQDLNNVTQTVNSYEYGSTCYLIDLSKPMYTSPSFVSPDNVTGAIITIDMQNSYGNDQQIYYITSTTNSWTNKKDVSAHYNAGMAYDYYYSHHGRNAIDDKGGNIVSIVNVPDDDGQPLDNAYWNGYYMFYGNGNVSFKPLAGGLDVGGHELTHGVVENTANLIYEGEAGAINESMADIFGVMIENEDWLIGEDVVVQQQFPSGALRSMSDPHNGGTSLGDRGYQPANVSEQYTGTQDNGGVHINSGICNHAFYLFAQAIGKDDAADVYYKALKDYLTKSSQFIDLRLAVIKAATDIYGAGSEEVTQAGTAFDAVGITDGQGTNNNPDLPENPGDEYLLVYNTDPADDGTLYRSNLELTELTQLSKTPYFALTRPSVSDNGEWAVFAAADSTIHGVVTLPGEDPDEWVVASDHYWFNAVLSKDGNRMALVSNYADATITLYDFITDQPHDFTLYNPTYTEGVEGSGVQWAESMEFDYTGEYLVYDAYNKIDNGDGNPLEFYNINFIKVWDNETNTFGDGTIYQLFSDIEKGYSIGNPTFSKNSSNIIALDYWNNEQEIFDVVGVNIEDNTVGLIAENNMVGWPTFNKTDGQLAFTSWGGSDYQVNYTLLTNEKIYADGDVQNMFTGGGWPIYFSVGERSTGIREAETQKSLPQITIYPNPFTGSVTLEIPAELQQKCTVEILSQTGQIVYSGAYDIAGSNTVTLDLKQLASGCYFLRLKDENSVFSGKIIKTE